MKIKDFALRGVLFTKKNPTIFYSLALIGAITAIIFFNSYFFLLKFQENTDKVLRSKALLAENVIHSFIIDFNGTQEDLAEKIREIELSDSQIREIAILRKENSSESYNIFISSREIEVKEEKDLDIEKNLNTGFLEIARQNEEGVAFLDFEDGERLWNVVKPLNGNNGKFMGLLLFRVSLAQTDYFTEKAIGRIYIVSIVSIIVVLLLVANHARLFRYAIRATELEEVDKMKDDFISMASHELKTPLSAIRGYIDILNDEKNLSPEAEKYLKNMEISAKRLQELVEDLLEVSRLEQNRIPFKNEEFQLNNTVSLLIEEFSLSAKNKGIDFELGEVEDLTVFADPERVKQILVNLIGNSIKYTNRGKVEIKISSDNKFAYVKVADTGVGMSSEEMCKLFEKFYRVKNEDTKEISGSGLGLWISREMARKMGGEITVESMKGVGSHFTLKIKRAKENKND